MQLFKCLMAAIAAFFIAGISTSAVLMFMMKDSDDGQAGMGPAAAGMYVGLAAAAVAFIITMIRTDRSS